MRRCFESIVFALLILGQAGCSTTKKDAGESTSQKSPDEIAVTMAGPPYPYPLDHWTDREEAREKGESALYQNALLRQADALDTLSMQELCARVLRFADALEEETQWRDRIEHFLFSDAVRKPVDAAVIKSSGRLNMWVVLTYGELDTSLDYAIKPNHDSFWRKQLQANIVRTEREMPIIQRERRALVEMLGREIPKLTTDTESRYAKDMKIIKALAMRGAAAPGTYSELQQHPSNAAPIFPVAVPHGARGLLLEYNRFPLAKAETSCRADISIVPANSDSMPTTETVASRWIVNGIITIIMDDAVIDVPLSGSLELIKDETPSVSRWCIRAGTLDITTFGTSIARLVLLDYADNTITLDGSGKGNFIAVFQDENATGPKSLPFYSIHLLKLPAKLTGDAFAIHLPTTRVGDLATFEPRTSSDFNKDGVLEYGSDFAAYLRDFDLHTPLADMNDDGQWDARDIDLWLAAFWEDHTASWQRPD